MLYKRDKKAKNEEDVTIDNPVRLPSQESVVETVVQEPTVTKVETKKEVVMNHKALSLFRNDKTYKWYIVEIPLNKETLELGTPVVRELPDPEREVAYEKFKIELGDTFFE